MYLVYLHLIFVKTSCGAAECSLGDFWHRTSFTQLLSAGKPGEGFLTGVKDDFTTTRELDSWPVMTVHALLVV